MSRSPKLDLYPCQGVLSVNVSVPEVPLGYEALCNNPRPVAV